MDWMCFFSLIERNKPLNPSSTGLRSKVLIQLSLFANISKIIILAAYKKIKVRIFSDKCFSVTNQNINLFLVAAWPLFYLGFAKSKFKSELATILSVKIDISKTVKLSQGTLLCYHFQWGRFCISRTETPVRQGEVNKKTWSFGPDNSYLKTVLCHFTRIWFDETKVSIWSSKTSKHHEGGFCSSYTLCSHNSSCLCSTLFHSAHFSNTLTTFRVPEQFGLCATHNTSPLTACGLTNLWQSFCHSGIFSFPTFRVHHYCFL